MKNLEQKYPSELLIYQPLCRSVSDCKLEIAPKIRFRKVVLENQVCRGLKMSLKMY